MCAIKLSHAATSSANWQELTGVHQLLYFAHLISLWYIQSYIEPPQIRRDRAILLEYKKAQQLTDRAPVKKILRETPKSRLRSRRTFVTEAVRLASLNQRYQQTWEQSGIEGVPPGHDVVTNPTCPHPGFSLPRRQFVTLNRLRCGQARCAESLYRWGVIASPACPRGKSHQTTSTLCPLIAFPWGLRCHHEAGPDAVEWLSKLSTKLWEYSKRTTTTALLILIFLLSLCICTVTELSHMSLIHVHIYYYLFLRWCQFC